MKILNKSGERKGEKGRKFRQPKVDHTKKFSNNSSITYQLSFFFLSYRVKEAKGETEKENHKGNL